MNLHHYTQIWILQTDVESNCRYQIGISDRIMTQRKYTHSVLMAFPVTSGCWFFSKFSLTRKRWNNGLSLVGVQDKTLLLIFCSQVWCTRANINITFYYVLNSVFTLKQVAIWIKQDDCKVEKFLCCILIGFLSISDWTTIFT